MLVCVDRWLLIHCKQLVHHSFLRSTKVIQQREIGPLAQTWSLRRLTAERKNWSIKWYFYICRKSKKTQQKSEKVFFCSFSSYFIQIIECILRGSHYSGLLQRGRKHPISLLKKIFWRLPCLRMISENWMKRMDEDSRFYSGYRSSVECCLLRAIEKYSAKNAQD